MIRIYVCLVILQQLASSSGRIISTDDSEEASKDKIAHLLLPLLGSGVQNDDIKVQVVPYEHYKDKGKRPVASITPVEQAHEEVPVAVILAQPKYITKKHKATPEGKIALGSKHENIRNKVLSNRGPYLESVEDDNDHEKSRKNHIIIQVKRNKDNNAHANNSRGKHIKNHYLQYFDENSDSSWESSDESLEYTNHKNHINRIVSVTGHHDPKSRKHVDVHNKHHSDESSSDIIQDVDQNHKHHNARPKNESDEIDSSAQISDESKHEANHKHGNLDHDNNPIIYINIKNNKNLTEHHEEINSLSEESDSSSSDDKFKIGIDPDKLNYKIHEGSAHQDDILKEELNDDSSSESNAITPIAELNLRNDNHKLHDPISDERVQLKSTWSENIPHHRNHHEHSLIHDYNEHDNNNHDKDQHHYHISAHNYSIEDISQINDTKSSEESVEVNNHSITPLNEAYGYRKETKETSETSEESGENVILHSNNKLHYEVLESLSDEVTKSPQENDRVEVNTDVTTKSSSESEEMNLNRHLYYKSEHEHHEHDPNDEIKKKSTYHHLKEENFKIIDSDSHEAHYNLNRQHNETDITNSSPNDVSTTYKDINQSFNEYSYENTKEKSDEISNKHLRLSNAEIENNVESTEENKKEIYKINLPFHGIEDDAKDLVDIISHIDGVKVIKHETTKGTHKDNAHELFIIKDDQSKHAKPIEILSNSQDGNTYKRNYIIAKLGIHKKHSDDNMGDEYRIFNIPKQKIENTPKKKLHLKNIEELQYIEKQILDAITCHLKKSVVTTKDDTKSYNLSFIFNKR